jgi:hypothetical protein
VKRKFPRSTDSAGQLYRATRPISARAAIPICEVSENDFPPELAAFVAAEIQSVEQLEILLLLSGNPHRWWTAQAVYEVIKSNLGSVKERLEDFTKKLILKKDNSQAPSYQFSPENQGIWQLVSGLREAYKERPVKVVQAIYSKRSDPVTEFARAFKITKEKNG